MHKSGLLCEVIVFLFQDAKPIGVVPLFGSTVKEGMYVCVYCMCVVCMYIMYVCTYVYVYSCSMYVCVYVCVCICV